MTLQLYATVTGSAQGDFKGEATSTRLVNKIPGVAFSYGIVDPHDAASGAFSGKRQQQPIVFTKVWGASSPQFYQAAYTNEVLTSVLFEFFLPLADDTESLDHTVRLTNAIVSSSRQSVHLGQLNGPLVDSRELHVISFHFEKIEIISLTGETEAAADWQMSF
ncbi:MAG: type VI secretion system tube protein TssD [Edaphobacter sp.]